MPLQSNINTWKGIYDNTGINAGGGNPAYIGSVLDVNGGYHTGTDIYQTGNKIASSRSRVGLLSTLK
ncbi:hypothetical protein [Stutzerimonas kirkiae]|uniref:hypothetical protein n=1 Tax=Stutzerimonas kirkiae TaxID=2211392 RepID=UPI00103837FA|nr:hypothetical protein [Stutzerimonas kirkiae]TBV17338.1 hypothetical protein DNK01_00250 [Stutzerimonas kirkiae]